MKTYKVTIQRRSSILIHDDTPTVKLVKAESFSHDGDTARFFCGTQLEVENVIHSYTNVISVQLVDVATKAKAKKKKGKTR